MVRFIVLGAGRVGAVIAADLAGEAGAEVTVADAGGGALAAARAREPRLRALRADLRRPEAVRELVAPFDVVVGALPSALGFAALRAVVEAGKACADISFTVEDPLALDGLARERGARVVVDFGVAPGMSHLLAAEGVRRLGDARSVRILVGGIPRDPEVPWRFKAAFAPGDVVEEYTRPARVREGGEDVTKPALSDRERAAFEGVGELEAATTDGLRTLLRTLAVPDMVEKTLRWPGHYDRMEELRASGFFASEPVEVSGARVAPLELTRALLARAWTYAEGEQDLTVMRVEVASAARRLAWELVDLYDAATRTTSMARTTAFPCAIVARLLADGTVGEPGIHPPERLADIPGAVERVLAEHARRGVRYRASETPPPG